MRLAVLSNINLNATLRLLKKDLEVFASEGYGNELGYLMNRSSSLYRYEPNMIFIIDDLMELICHELHYDRANAYITQWFATFEETLDESVIYYINDAYLWGQEIDILPSEEIRLTIEQSWNAGLKKLCDTHKNVRVFPYRRLIEKEGEKAAFSLKMWYLGKILHAGGFQTVLKEEIKYLVQLETTVAKKLLLLDLDNTLWGGLAGENDITPIELSEDHNGLAYKNLQRVLLEMQKNGVLLGIVSKNNLADAEEILTHHPHMVLQSEDFVVKKINWEPKYENIQRIAKELNIGLNSIVFFDDSPMERESVQEMLPEVTVPDFPAQPENLAAQMVQIYREYFAKPCITTEDKLKTKQYQENSKRANLQEHAASFDEYLTKLQIHVISKEPKEHLDRITQLLNKTNQFNLTTRRHTQGEIQEFLADKNKRIYAYQVTDCFGDNGLVAVVIVNTANAIPVIEEFVMSCRVMGRNIENAIIDFVEHSLQAEGFTRIQALYLETAKNQPVANLYSNLGYQPIDTDAKEKVFENSLPSPQKRDYQIVED